VSSTAPAKAPPPAEKPTEARPPQARSDAYEAHGLKSTSGAHRLEEAFAHAGSPSGIENLVRLLDGARGQLAGEHGALRLQSQDIVERLVASGFAPAQLEQARAQLLELRKKMAALRKRLHHLQRRLKSAFASAGKTGDAGFAKQLGTQLEKLRNMEPGLSRALLALQTIEQAYGSFADGSFPLLRLAVEENETARAAAVGTALAAVTPGAAIAQATLALLRDGPEAAPPGGTHAKGRLPALEGTAALADALLPPAEREPG
jgi:hypothetical protein